MKIPQSRGWPADAGQERSCLKAFAPAGNDVCDRHHNEGWFSRHDEQAQAIVISVISAFA
jgi:hypothetical protein